jgi:hypothetical protein
VEIKSPSISSETKPKKISQSSGLRGGSLHSPTENARRPVEAEAYEIVENSPLVDIEKVVQERITKVGLIIEPEPIYHAIRIQYLFGGKEHPTDTKSQDQIHREEQLYLKVVEGLRALDEVEDDAAWFNTQGWVWPELYLDENKNFAAHFTIQMHRNGRFIIPLRRDINLKEFWYEFSIIFSTFLSEDELGDFVSSLLLVKRCDDGKYRYMRYDDGSYIHLAHKINPDKRIEELGLNKAKVVLHFINYEDNPKVKVYIDKSTGDYEIEGEFETPEGKDLFDLIKRGSVVSGNLSKINRQMDQIDYDLNDIHALQVAQYQEYQTSVGTLQQVQTFLEEQEKNGSVKLLNEIDAHLENYSNLYLTELDEKTELILKSQQDLYEENNVVLSNILGNTKVLNENIGVVGKNIENLSILTNNSTQILDQSLDALEQSTKADTDLLLHGQTEINKNIEALGKTLGQQLDTLKEFMRSQFSSLRSDFRNNLYLVLRAIHQLPGATIEDLFSFLESELDVSKRTLYNYMKELQDRDLISSRKEKSTKKGRPARRFNLSEKVRTIMRK